MRHPQLLAPAACAVVVIEASSERARLFFQTRDGRRAERIAREYLER